MGGIGEMAMPDQAAQQGQAALQGGSRPSAGPRIPERRTSSRSTVIGVAGALLTAAAIAGVVMMTGPAPPPSAVAPTPAVAPATVPAPFEPAKVTALAPNVAPVLSPVAAPTPAPAPAKEPAATSPGTIERIVNSGEELVVSQYMFWNGSCNASKLTVNVTQPPAGGTVSVTEELFTIPAKAEVGVAAVKGVGSCVGRQIMGKQILYQSRPGFHGRDVLAYEYISDLGLRVPGTVIITVR
jgi:hypothetical protein